MIRRVAILTAPALFVGCLGQPREEPVTPPAADPNQSMVLSAQGNPTIQETARTSLLEDNEHLRDLLSKALADKRDLERRLQDTIAEKQRLDSHTRSQADSITSLSEQIGVLKVALTKLGEQRDRLEKERRTLAEMYAVEKRQRLAFEKELLEMEIASRTHDRRDGRNITEGDG